MNDTTFFRRYAASAGCRNENTQRRIHEFASKGSTDTTTSEPNLLPTRERLCRAFANEQTVYQYLICPCQLCGNDDRVGDDGGRREQLAAKIVAGGDEQKVFAIMVLSGCLFAYRNFILRHDIEDLSSLSDKLETLTADDHSGSSLRQRLLGHVSSPELRCTTGDHTSGDTSSSPGCLRCLADTLKDSINENRRLFNVKKFQILSGALRIPEYLHRDNLPFIDAVDVQVGKWDHVKRFWRCKIDLSCCESAELRGMSLFRKRYLFSSSNATAIQHAVREAKIAITLKNQHERIAKILLAFKVIDGDLTMVNLIFKHANFTLEDYLSGRPLGRVRDLIDDRSGSRSVLVEHGLWKSILEIVEAVATIHEMTNKLIDNECRIKGHFDIQASNILIDETGSLLLTDFGQAAEVRTGAIAYAPPSPEMDFTYDTFSLGCLLLEILIFINATIEVMKGDEALSMFHVARLNEDATSDSFWRTTGHSNSGHFVLRDAVQQTFGRLLAQRRHPHTQNVIRQVNLMLNCDTSQRPQVRDCLIAFKAKLGREVFNVAGQELVDCSLEKWLTNFTTDTQQDPLPCRLYLYRPSRDENVVEQSRRRGNSLEEVNLTLEYDGRADRGLTSNSRSDIRLMKEMFFVPILQEAPRPGSMHVSYRRNSTRDAVASCAFVNFFRGTKLHFLNLTNYFDFMALMTHQIALSDSWRAGDGSSQPSLNFKQCVLRRHRTGLSSTFTMYGGYLQVWKLLTEDEFVLRYESSSERPNRLLPLAEQQQNHRHTPVSMHGRPNSLKSHYKMALFGFDSETSERVCLIVDIGSNSFTTVFDQECGKFEFKEKNSSHFEAAIFRASQQAALGITERGYVGFPMSPDIVQSHMGDGEHGLRLKTLDLELEPFHDKLYRIFRAESFPVTE